MKVSSPILGVLKVVQVTSGKFVWAVYLPDGKLFGTYKRLNQAKCVAKRNNIIFRRMIPELL